MSRTYAVVGAGRQGAAVAYDLALHGSARWVRLLDADPGVAGEAVRRVNRLLEQAGAQPCVQAGSVDASDADAARDAMEDADAVLSAVPYHLNLPLAEAAIEAGSSFCDLGGHTGIVQQELRLDDRARAAGVTITPDCGVAPGMVNTLAAYLIGRVHRPRRVAIRVGGLPQRPRPPLDYLIVFAVEGLTNEYSGEALVLRDGAVQRVPTLEEREELYDEALGPLEAFTTAGGTSICPYTYQGVLESYDYKTIRYPGHLEKARVLRDLGLLSTEPVEVPVASGGRASVAPREVLHRCLAPRLAFPGDRDLLLLRVTCEGEDASGQPVRQRLRILDRHDEATGFSAMERMTAFPAAIVCAYVASGLAPRGAVPVDKAMPGELFLEALKKRGIPLTETVSRVIG